MLFHRCFVVLGIVVRLIEGTNTTVSQTEATSITSSIEVDLKTDSQIVASSPRPTLTSTIKVNLTTTSGATAARRTTSTSPIEVNLTTAYRKEATRPKPTTSTIQVNLTTATWTLATLARPTSLLRRIDVRKEDYVKRNTDIFYQRARHSKRRAGAFGNMWQWDYWCMLQPITGNCGTNTTKYEYYYNQQVNDCLPHMFTGCRNNKNQFESIQECHNYCKGSALMPMPVHLPYNTDLCKLQPISGRCLGQEIMYYYDVNANLCKTFMYGGCAGNNNRFSDENECLDRCASKAHI